MDYLPSFPLEISPLASFGLLLVLGALAGYIAHRAVWLPSITGFMVIGFLAGPTGLDLLSEDILSSTRVFVDVALGLILYRLGLTLHIQEMLRSRAMLIASAVEGGLTFFLVAYVMTLFDVPLVVAMLIAAIAISSSPAVLLHVAHEMNARGVVTETAMSMVSLNNVMSFLLFSAMLPVVHLAADAGWGTIIIQPIYQLAGSTALGLGVAYALHYVVVKTRRAPQYNFALVIGAITITLGAANALKLSSLFAPLIVGIVVRTLERESILSKLEFGSAFELFFIVLFVYAGAHMHIHELIEFLPAILGLVLVRSFAKTAGVTATRMVLGGAARPQIATGLLLIPMAGMAIGLVQASGHMFPQYSQMLIAIVLGAVSVFETLGPPIASYAFRLAGEAHATPNNNNNNNNHRNPVDDTAV